MGTAPFTGARYSDHERLIDTLPPLRRGHRRTHQLSARKSLGQNFLLDLNLTAKIARQAGDLSQNAMCLKSAPVPVGLTRGLLSEGARKVRGRGKRYSVPCRHWNDIAEAASGSACR